jgi:hypothetical protein
MIATASQNSSLDPLLLPDRDEPYQLQDVFERRVYGLRDEIILDFGDCFLRFKAEPDYDTITACFHGRAFGSKRGYQNIGSAPPWRRFLKKNCGWTWSARSQQGYWDTILISFDAVIPNVLLYVMASSIFVGTIGPLKDRHNEKGSKARRNKESASQN